jgi:tetratricopeptide (TPR) repeat protein
MTKRDLIGALVLCTEALVLCDDKQRYSVLIKRSDCFSRLHEYEKALEDTLRAIKYADKNVTVPYHRCVRIYISLGMLVEAEKFIKQHPQIFKDSPGADKFRSDMQKLQNYLDDVSESSMDYEKSLKIVNDALKIAQQSCEFLALKIKFLVLLKRFEEVKEVDQLIDKRFGKILKISEAFRHYYEGSFDKCNFETISKTLKLKLIDELKEKVEDIEKNFELGKIENFKLSFLII